MSVVPGSALPVVPLLGGQGWAETLISPYLCPSNSPKLLYSSRLGLGLLSLCGPETPGEFPHVLGYSLCLAVPPRRWLMSRVWGGVPPNCSHAFRVSMYLLFPCPSPTRGLHYLLLAAGFVLLAVRVYCEVPCHLYIRRPSCWAS